MLEQIISLLPDSLSRIRYWYYSGKLKYTGGLFWSRQGFKIDEPQNVSIGKNVSFCRNVFLATLGHPGTTSEIIIGDNCFFGPNVVIVAGNHIVDKFATLQDIPSKIVIEDECWIGTGVVISKSVIVGKHSIIGANSVVTHDVPSYSVAVGCPARVIKSIE